MNEVGVQDNQVKLGKNKGIATFLDGVKRDEEALVLNADGKEVWGQVPYVEELAHNGFPEGDIYMEVGNSRYGYLHIMSRHGAEILKFYKKGTPLHEVIDSFVSDVFSSIEKLHIDRSFKKGRKAKNYFFADSTDFSGQKNWCLCYLRKIRIDTSFIPCIAMMP